MHMKTRPIRGWANLGLWAWLAMAPAAHAAERAALTQETRPVDARVVRVRLEGVVDLRIRQGATPALVLSGEPAWLSRTVTTQSGDTLRIDTEMQGRMRSGLHAELTLPALREVVSESLGSTVVEGFSGDALSLTLEGAGAMRVAADYRVVKASLGGIGSMRLDGVSGDGVELNLQGAGVVTLTGRARWLKADLGGLGSLDAQQFNADSVDIDLSGLGNARVTAHQNVNLNLSGLGSVTVYGKPLNRKVSVDGLGKVSWK
jgi:hypothetical protein